MGAGQGRIEDRTRNELLAEVVVFANAYGGWLLVGIEETGQKPARASAVAPVRACAELAERLRLMCRDCIDPRLPVLEVEGVPMQDNGAGVVVFHIPRSRMAPHRLTPTKGCYRRHADRTEEMDMREIQDLTLQVERGMAAVDRRFEERKEEFATRFDEFKVFGRMAFGIRATLVPLTPLYIDRVHGNDAARPPQHELICTARGGTSYKIFIPQNTATWRPTIRGSILRESGESRFLLQEVNCDGLIEYRFMRKAEGQQGEEPLRIPVVWVMGLFCNALCGAEAFRRAAGTLDVEYGLEFEIANQGPGDLSVGNYGGHLYGNWLGPFPKGRTIFPRYSIGPADEFQRLAQTFERDFWDAVGHEPSSLADVDFHRAFRELGIVTTTDG